MPILYPGFGDYSSYDDYGDYEEGPSPFERNYFEQDEPNPFLKRNNPFLNTTPTPTPTPEPTPPPAPSAPETTGFEFKEGPLSGKYREFIQEPPPSRDDFKPTKMQRFGAFLGAVGSDGGYKGARDILDRPYNEAIAERERRGKELSSGARQESETEQEAFRKWYQQQQLDQGKRKLDIDADNKKSLAERRQAMTQIQDWRAKNPGFNNLRVKGGNVYAFNKGTGEMKDTGISSGTMTDEDLLGQNQLNALEKIEAQGGQARETERVRQEGRIELNDARSLSNQELEKQRQTGRISLEDAKVAGREKLLQFAVDHPKYTKVEVKGGNYHFVNPNDPTDSVNSGISTGTLSEDDSIVKRLGGGTTTVTTVNPEGTQRTVKTTRTPGIAPPANAAAPATPSRTRSATASPNPAKPQTMTAPDGKVYPTTGWTDRDYEAARRKGFK